MVRGVGGGRMRGCRNILGRQRNRTEGVEEVEVVEMEVEEPLSQRCHGLRLPVSVVAAGEGRYTAAITTMTTITMVTMTTIMTTTRRMRARMTLADTEEEEGEEDPRSSHHNGGGRRSREGEEEEEESDDPEGKGHGGGGGGGDDGGGSKSGSEGEDGYRPLL